MNEDLVWLWLVVGLLPYAIERRWRRDRRALQMRALFWSLEVWTQDARRRGRRRARRNGRGRPARRTWTLRVPLIEHLRDGVWAAVLRLRNDAAKH